MTTEASLPRVTEILAAVGLAPDYGAIRPDVLEAARVRGVAVHAGIEAIIYGYDDPALDDPACAPYLDAWRKFAQDSRYIASTAEVQVVHPTWRYRGHPDSVGMLGAKRTLIDVKTGDLGAVDYQVAAYVEAWNASRPTTPVVAGIGLQLRDDGTYRVHEIDLNAARPVWYAALTVWRAQRKA